MSVLKKEYNIIDASVNTKNRQLENVGKNEHLENKFVEKSKKGLM